jgi:hypothetical protein
MKYKPEEIEQKKKCFYDIHMHAFDLSHPNRLAFIDRMFDNVSGKWYFKSFRIGKIVGMRRDSPLWLPLNPPAIGEISSEP